MVKVDIKIKILPISHRVYMVRPGTGYHLLAPMIANKVVAPDLAFLDFPDGQRPRDAQGIDLQITRARAFADWVKTDETRQQAVPSKDITHFAPLARPHRLSMYRNLADELLHGLPEGTLVFVPHPDLTRDGMFGELVSAKAPRLRFQGTAHRSEFTYLGRRLRNVKMLPMRKLPAAFFEPMGRRNWTFEYGAAETELLYRQYYGDFEIIGKKAVTEIEVKKHRVGGPDLSIVGGLTNLVDQTLARVANGDKDRLSMSDAVFMPSEPKGAVFHANFGSQGNLLIESVVRRTAPVVKVIIALAIAGYLGSQVWDMVQAGSLVLENSGSLTGAEQLQLAETQNQTYDFVRATGRENLNEVMELVREFHGRTGGEVDANISVND